MKVIVAIAVLFALVVASVSMCTYKVYRSFDDFPEQADIKHLNQRYAQLVTDLNNSIEQSDSAYSLASALENINYPTETLYVGMQKEDQDNEKDTELPIMDRRVAGSGSKMRMLINGGGYGRANGQHFWILQHPLNKYEYEHIEILFEREAPVSDKQSGAKADTE